MNTTNTFNGMPKPIKSGSSDLFTLGFEEFKTLRLEGGILEDYRLIELADKWGRIVPDGTLVERAADAKRYLEFLGFEFASA